MYIYDADETDNRQLKNFVLSFSFSKNQRN